MRLSAIKQYAKLLDGHTRIGNDSAKSSHAKLFVVGNDCAKVRIFATQAHMTTGLMTKDKARARQRLPDLATGQVGRKLSRESSGIDFDDFLARLGGYWIASCTTVLNVQPNGLTDVGERLLPAIALTNTPWERRNAGHISAIGFSL